MLRIARAELQYSLGSLLAWLGVLIVATWWPFLEARSLSAVPGTLAIMALALPLITPVSCFLLLNIERNERRRRLWSMLPVNPVAVAVARLLRAATLPLFAVALGLLLVVLAAIFIGGPVFEQLSGGWVLWFLLLSAIALGALVTLLYDIGGMAFAQLSVALLAGAGFVLNSFVPAVARLVHQVSTLAQSPGGVILMGVVCVLVLLADVLVFRARRS